MVCWDTLMLLYGPLVGFQTYLNEEEINEGAAIQVDFRKCHSANKMIFKLRVPTVAAVAALRSHSPTSYT